MRNQGLCGEDFQRDLPKINAPMLNALAKVAPKGGWIRLEKVADAFEETFGAALGAYPTSNVVRSRIASEILETLGFTGKKQGGKNYTLVFVNSDLLQNLTAESATGHPVGALVIHKKLTISSRVKIIS